MIGTKCIFRLLLEGIFQKGTCKVTQFLLRFKQREANIWTPDVECYVDVGNGVPDCVLFSSLIAFPRQSRGSIMADFDAIYEEEEEHEGTLEETYVALVPDPVVVRGAGNMTV